MKQVTLHIAESEFDTFMKFIKTLHYVEVEDLPQSPLEELQDSLHQVKLMRDGKLPKQLASDFLNEL